MPTGQLNTSNLSIEQHIKGQQENSNTQPTDLPSKPFEKDDVVLKWKSAAVHEKQKGQEQLYLAMTNREIQQIDATHFRFEVDNNYQFGLLKGAMEGILQFIRTELQNGLLQITIEESTDIGQEDKFLTGKDKFDKMAKKNGNLIDFKNRFGLDVEY